LRRKDIRWSTIAWSWIVQLKIKITFRHRFVEFAYFADSKQFKFILFCNCFFLSFTKKCTRLKNVSACNIVSWSRQTDCLVFYILFHYIYLSSSFCHIFLFSQSFILTFCSSILSPMYLSSFISIPLSLSFFL
jgi:hypothetical protein